MNGECGGEGVERIRRVKRVWMDHAGCDLLFECGGVVERAAERICARWYAGVAARREE